MSPESIQPEWGTVGLEQKGEFIPEPPIQLVVWDDPLGQYNCSSKCNRFVTREKGKMSIIKVPIAIKKRTGKKTHSERFSPKHIYHEFSLLVNCMINLLIKPKHYMGHKASPYMNLITISTPTHKGR